MRMRDRTTLATRLRVSQIETPFDALDATVHSIQAIRHIGVLIFKIADTLLDFANLVAHIVNRAADMAQMLQNDVVRIGHKPRVSQKPIVGNGTPAASVTSYASTKVNRPSHVSTRLRVYFTAPI